MGVHLLGGLVEHLALRRERLRPIDKRFELFASFEDRFNCLVLLGRSVKYMNHSTV